MSMQQQAQINALKGEIEELKARIAAIESGKREKLALKKDKQ